MLHVRLPWHGRASCLGKMSSNAMSIYIAHLVSREKGWFRVSRAQLSSYTFLLGYCNLWLLDTLGAGHSQTAWPSLLHNLCFEAVMAIFWDFGDLELVSASAINFCGLKQVTFFFNNKIFVTSFAFFSLNQQDLHQPWREARVYMLG